MSQTSNLGVRGSNPFRRAKHLASDFRAKNLRPKRTSAVVRQALPENRRELLPLRV